MLKIIQSMEQITAKEIDFNDSEAIAEFKKYNNL